MSHIIVEGPVTHAGATSDAGPLFSYDGSRRQIVVGTEIWRELSLSGHWIQDALILRWAELTSEISRKTISPSEVIERLLRIPVRERNVLDARKVYCDLPSGECVWSGGPLGSRFDVDHVLPYSLWRNNDLWNLLPANPQVNRDKGDRLPTNALLKRRRDVILRYWDVLHEANPKRFEHEVNRLSGIRELHLPRTFDVVSVFSSNSNPVCSALHFPAAARRVLGGTCVRCRSNERRWTFRKDGISAPVSRVSGSSSSVSPQQHKTFTPRRPSGPALAHNAARRKPMLLVRGTDEIVAVVPRQTAFQQRTRKLADPPILESGL